MSTAGRETIDPVSHLIGRFDQFEKHVDQRFAALERLLYVIIGVLVAVVGGGLALYARVAEIAARLPPAH